MGRKTFVVNGLFIWLSMALAYDFFHLATAIDQPTNSSILDYNSNLTQASDSHFSGSERNRRLIPYMAFYLPPTELPINQQYAVVQNQPKLNRYTTNSTQSQPSPEIIESAGPLPPPGYIALPTAYVRMKITNGDGTAPQPQPQQQQQSRYRPVVYDNSYPVTLNFKSPIGTAQPLLHLLPPGPPGHVGGTPYGNVIYKEAHVNKLQKGSIQHFPPLQQQQQQQSNEDNEQQQINFSQQEQQQQQRLHEQPILYRQRPHSPSQANLTPFTSSNTVPGHFVPIIYTPASSNGNNHGGKTINYNYDDTPEELPTLQQQQQYIASYKESQRQQQIAAEPLVSPPPPSSSDSLSETKEAQLLKQQPQINFIAIAGVAGPTAGSTTATQSGPIYHVIKETSPTTPISSASPPYQTLIALKPQQLQYRPSKHQNFHAPKPESFFNEEDEQQQQHQQDSKQAAKQQQQHQHQQQQYYNANDLTPQEKYVLYLRQRIRYNKQQQSKQKQRGSTSSTSTAPTAITKDRKQYLIQQYQQQQQQQQQEHTPSTHSDVYLYDTVAPAPAPNDGLSISVQPPLQHQQQQQQQNYAQHNPHTHTVYLRPEISVSTNQQLPSPASTGKQQVLRIPVRAILSGFDALPKTNPNRIKQQQQHPNNQHKYSQYSNPLGPPNYQQLDEPKQYLEEQYPQHAPNQQQEQQQSEPVPEPAGAPPQAAYIIITTSRPPTYQSKVPTQPEYHLSTQRPIYPNPPPTLRLHPIATQEAKYQHATKRPNFILSKTTPSSSLNSITKQQYDYKYVSTTPSYKQIATATPAIRLKPSTEFESNRIPVATPRPQVQHQQQQQPLASLEDPNQLPDIRTSSLAEILHKLQASNHLPQTLTADNIDNSIKTLITILNNLKQTQTIVPNPPQHHEPVPAQPDYDYNNGNEEPNHEPETDLNIVPPPTTPHRPNKHPGPSTGRAGIDYPNYAEIPKTSFDCGQQRYKGFFGDPETSCQVWHYCDLNGGKASFLCPNGTIFSQIALTCDWWFNVKCAQTPQLYVLNERLYKYILPFNPKFPEDYSGPIVDKYLAMKFQEMEEKMRLEKDKANEKLAITEHTENHIEEPTSTAADTHKLHEEIRQKVDEQSSERNLLTDDIVDDISERGSFDTYESSTQQTTTPNENENAPVPFSIKPIVVSSSTLEPDHLDDYSSTVYEQLKNNVGDDNAVESREHSNFLRSSVKESAKENAIKQQKQQERESSKISVEKVEVIEIKPDGASGHLTPDMFMNSMSSRR